QDPFQRGVHLLDLEHRLVDQLADNRLLGVRLEMLPAGGLGYPENIVGAVFVLVLGPFGIVALELRALRHEAIGDVLEEDQAEDDVLVIRRLHVAAELVRSLEQLGLEAEVAALAIGASLRAAASQPPLLMSSPSS